MKYPQLRLDFIETTEDHLRGFAHKHALEHREQSLEHVEGTTWFIKEQLNREVHSFEAEDVGQIIFDVTSIKLVLARRLPPFRMVRAHLTQEWADYTFRTCGCTEEGVARHALEDLDRPGIMVWFGEGRNAQIDGSHRLVRSWREGRKTFDMALIDIATISPFVVRQGDEDKLFEVAKALEQKLGLMAELPRGKILAGGKYMWKVEDGRETEL